MNVPLAFFLSSDKAEIKRAAKEFAGALISISPGEIMLEDLEQQWCTPPIKPAWQCASCGGPFTSADKNLASLLTRRRANRVQAIVLHMGCMEKRAHRSESPAKN